MNRAGHSDGSSRRLQLVRAVRQLLVVALAAGVPGAGSPAIGATAAEAARPAIDLLLTPPTPLIFRDGFESGSTTAWSAALP